MKQHYSLIVSMIVAILLSISIILVCENCCVFGAKSDVVENIFIGILSSSSIALIGYIVAYIAAINGVHDELESYYIRATPWIMSKMGHETNKEVEKMIENKVFFEQVRQILVIYRWLFKVDEFVIKIVNYFRRDNPILSILDVEWCPKYVRVARILGYVFEYYVVRSTIFSLKRFRFNMYKRSRKELETSRRRLGETYYRECLHEATQNFKTSYKKTIEMEQCRLEDILKLNLSEQCRIINHQLGLTMW